MSTSSPSLAPRHRGTWSTVSMVLLFTLGVCTVVFGVFTLPESVLRGISLALLGAGMTAPGLWWLRWYQVRSLRKYALGIAGILIATGATGMALDLRGEPAFEEELILPPTPAPSTVTSTMRSSTAHSSTWDMTSVEPEPSESLAGEIEPIIEGPSTSVKTSTVEVPPPVVPPIPVPGPLPSTAPPVEQPVPQPPVVEPELPVEEPPASEPPVEEKPPAQQDPLEGLLPRLPF